MFNSWEINKFVVKKTKRYRFLVSIIVSLAIIKKCCNLINYKTVLTKKILVIAVKV